MQIKEHLKSLTFFAIIGLVLAGFGFANFLVTRTADHRKLQTNQDLTNLNQALSASDLENLRLADDSLTYFASDSALATPPATPATQPTNQPASQTITIEAAAVRLEATQGGKTAFALLLENLPDTGYKKYDFGYFIESINNLKGDNSHFWAFYINGNKSEVGADSVVVKPGDVVEFKYETIEL